MLNTSRRRHKEPRRKRLLTREEEYNLAKRIQSGDNDAREQFISANYGLAISIAKKYYRNDTNFNDLVQEGYVGLLRAVNRFNPEMGNKFSTYATHWIRQAVLNYLNEGAADIKVPTHSRLLNSKLRKEMSALEKELKREPTLEEVSAAVDIPIKKIKYTLKANSKLAQLDDSFLNSNGSLKDTYKDESPYVDPEKNILSKELDVLIRKSLALLTPKEEKIIRLRFGITESPDDVENFPVTDKMLSYLEEDNITQTEHKENQLWKIKSM